MEAVRELRDTEDLEERTEVRGDAAWACFLMQLAVDPMLFERRLDVSGECDVWGSLDAGVLGF